MRLINQIDLKLASGGHVLRIFYHLAHHPHGIGGSVDLQQVDIATDINIQAGCTPATWIGTGTLLAVQ